MTDQEKAIFFKTKINQFNRIKKRYTYTNPERVDKSFEVLDNICNNLFGFHYSGTFSPMIINFTAKGKQKELNKYPINLFTGNINLS